MYSNPHKLKYVEETMGNIGELFENLRDYRQGADTKEFIEEFMISEVASFIDRGNPKYLCMGSRELLDEALKCGIKIKQGECFGGFMPNWIGQIYVLFGFTYNMSSKDMIKLISLEYLEKVYPGLHDIEPKLAIRKIYSQLERQDTHNIICFHNPDEENGYLSNWYLSDFNMDGLRFTSAEQYMMYIKAAKFNDSDVMQMIMATNDVSKIKGLGRKVRNYNDNVWNSIREEVMLRGLIAKFECNEELKQGLLNTGNSILAECAVRDTIWGIGISMRDSRRLHIKEWKGKNLLGYTLMKVRDHLSKLNIS